VSPPALRTAAVALVAGASLTAAALTACSGAPSTQSSDGHAPRSDRGPASSETPQLVVSLIFDQVGSDALDRYFDYLAEDGVFKRAAREGVLIRRSRYPYAGTYTAAGHATLATGASPRVHGVTSNGRWSFERQRRIPFFDDGEHGVLTADGVAPGWFASPVALGAPTVADQLEQQTAGRARTASLSFKDRGAIPAGGQRPDVALWFDPKRPGFTTSTYYRKGIPGWLVEWHVANPIDDRLGPWEPDDPALLRRVAGVDDAPGEGNLPGFGRVFPHSPGDTDAPASSFRATPAGGQYLLDLAGAVVRELQMGTDETPDFLSVSISATDYVGHVFGPDSWEYADALIRLDAAAGAFIAAIERNRRVAVVVSSDHGAAPLVETSRAAGATAARVDKDLLVRHADDAVDVAIEEGDWVAAYVPPYIELSQAAKTHPRRAEIRAAARAALEAYDGVARVFDVAALAAGPPPADRIARAAYESVHARDTGELLVVMTPLWIVDEGMPRGFGTTHGSPHPYDAEVPVALFGAGVAPLGDIDERTDQRRVAATLAILLGIEPAPSMAQPPLPGVRRASPAAGRAGR